MTEFEQYFTSVLDNKIVACNKMKKISEILLNRFVCPDEFHFDYNIAKRHTDFIEKFCMLPSGRIGTPFKLELFQKARFQALFGFVDDNDLRQYNECLIIEGRKNGKALALDTEIPTSKGFKKIKDVHIGDYVFGDDGKTHKVINESEIYKNHDCYRVTFKGDYTVICDAEHLWTVKNKKGKIVTKQTNQLLHFKRERKDKKGTEYLYRVPITKPVEYPEQNHLLDAYTFGIWLGDGSSRDARITVSQEDINETKKNLEEMGHATKIYKNKNRASSIGLDVVGVGKENKTLSMLRQLNVINNKHIPNLYLYSSINQRMELLKGLMDTDGYCDKAGQCEFCQKNEILADQVRELLSSLGIVSSKRKKTIICNGKKCHAYSILFYTDKKHSCFKLKRKHNRLKDNLNKRMNWNSIINIEKVNTVQCKCIAIDSDSHLYLATHNYIVTHNTSETAAVEVDGLVNDGEGSPQIYNVATMLDQAKLGFNAAHKMIKQSPMLNAHIKKRASDLYFAYNFGYIKALASNTNSLDGLDVHMAVIDELAAIKNRDIYDLIKQAMGARSQPLLFCITTNGFIREGIFDKQYKYATKLLDGKLKEENKRFLPFIYELDDISEWDKEECWIKANPGIGTIKTYDYLRQMVQKAKDDSSFRPTVLVKDFNMKQNSENAWLKWEELNNENLIPDYPYRYFLGGFDAADSIDLNSAHAIVKIPNDDNIYIKSMYWIPQRVIDEQEKNGDRKERDSVPYSQWIADGYMRTCEGNKVSKRVILDWFVELKDKHDIYPMAIGYDPWHVSDELVEAFNNEFGKGVLIPIRQGVITCSEPMKSLKVDFQEHKIIYDNNPIDKWCFYNSAVKTDINGNIQLVKKTDRTQRIDGMAALIDAYVVYYNKKEEFESLI